MNTSSREGGEEKRERRFYALSRPAQSPECAVCPVHTAGCLLQTSKFLLVHCSTLNTTMLDVAYLSERTKSGKGSVPFTAACQN